MTRKMLWSLVVISSILTFTAPAPADVLCVNFNPPAQCDFYQALIYSGQAVSNAGAGQFGTSPQIYEWVVLRRSGARRNPLEVVITNFSGELFGPIPSANLSNYPVGSIELMTNSLYANNCGIREASGDLAQVSVSQIQNPPGTLVQFQLIPFPVYGRDNVDRSPNNVVLPNSLNTSLGGAFFGAGATILNYLGAGLPAGQFVTQNQIGVPNTGSGYVFFPTSDPSLIYGEIGNSQQPIRTVDQQVLTPNGTYNARYVGRFYGRFQCQ